MNGNDFLPVRVEFREGEVDGMRAIRVLKPLSNLEPDTDTYAKLKDCSFHNGTIEVKMYANIQDGAPPDARGFIGIAFRVKEDNSKFECFYVRPTNGNHPDPIRRSHGSQYFSYPGYTFAYFRKHGIKGYEAPADIALHQWIDMKIVVREETADFYVKDMENPILHTDHLIHGKELRGSIGLYVDNGTEGFFRDLKIRYDD